MVAEGHDYEAIESIQAMAEREAAPIVYVKPDSVPKKVEDAIVKLAPTEAYAELPPTGGTSIEDSLKLHAQNVVIAEVDNSQRIAKQVEKAKAEIEAATRKQTEASDDRQLAAETLLITADELLEDAQKALADGDEGAAYQNIIRSRQLAHMAAVIKADTPVGREIAQTAIMAGVKPADKPSKATLVPRSSLQAAKERTSGITNAMKRTVTAITGGGGGSGGGGTTPSGGQGNNNLPQSCGNGICNGWETAENCPADCNTTVCGDGRCEGTETNETCPGDCNQSSGGGPDDDTNDTVTTCTTRDSTVLAVTNLAVDPSTIIVDETSPNFTVYIKNDGECDYLGSETGNGLDIVWVGRQTIIEGYIPAVDAGETYLHKINFGGTFSVRENPAKFKAVIGESSATATAAIVWEEGEPEDNETEPADCETSDIGSLTISSLSISPTTIIVDYGPPPTIFTFTIKNNGECNYAGARHSLAIDWVRIQNSILSGYYTIPKINAGATYTDRINYGGILARVNDPATFRLRIGNLSKTVSASVVNEETEDNETEGNFTCSPTEDGVCPGTCAPGTDYDCCTDAGKCWITGRGCYNSCSAGTGNCTASNDCSATADNCCPAWCTAGSDRDCCENNSMCWTDGIGCHTCANSSSS